MAKKDFVDKGVETAAKELSEKEWNAKADKGQITQADWDARNAATAKRGLTTDPKKYKFSDKGGWGKPGSPGSLTAYKDSMGDRHEDGTRDGSLGDGSETAVGKGTYQEERERIVGAISKRGDYAKLSKYAHDEARYAEDVKDNGGGYAARNAAATAQSANKKATEMGTVARQKLVEKYRKQR